jgi:hypothetical protein
LLEDGMDIITLKDLWATKPWNYVEYLQIAQLESTKIQPTWHTFAQCSPKPMYWESLEKNRNYRIKHLAITHLISYKTMQNGRIGHIDACDECGNSP